MTQKDNGGPAFPGESVVRNGMHSTKRINNPGMTLRDYFAGQSIHAAQAMVLNYMPVSNPQFQANVAHHAYELADAMLSERNK